VRAFGEDHQLSEAALGHQDAGSIEAGGHGHQSAAHNKELVGQTAI